MLGAIIGDVIGSRFEWDNIKSKEFDLFNEECEPTDDSFMTLAIEEAIMDNYPIDYSKEGLERLKKSVINKMVKYYNDYPYAGYGGHFEEWCRSKEHLPYNSLGNGAGMRVSCVGWIANSIQEVKMLSNAVTEITHNHSEGLKGAESIAMCIYLARMGKSKQEIKEYVIDNYYPRLKDLNYDDLVKNYTYNVTAPFSTPEAIYCFLIANDFEDTIRNAISIGGDSDTIACMAGAIAEAYYGIPNSIINDLKKHLDPQIQFVIDIFYNFLKLTIEGISNR